MAKEGKETRLNESLKILHHRKYWLVIEPFGFVPSKRYITLPALYSNTCFTIYTAVGHAASGQVSYKAVHST